MISPAAESKSVSFTSELLLRRFVDPHEGDETGFVVVLDLVEDGASVAGLRDERQVVQQVGKTGIRSKQNCRKITI